MVNKEKDEKMEEDGKSGSEDNITSDGLIARANAAAERLEKANEELEKNLARQEALAVETRLGGQSDAGKSEKKEEESPEEYARKVLANEVEEK